MESFALYAHREALDDLRSAIGRGFDPARVHRATGDALLRLGRYREATVSYEQAAAAIAPADPVALAVVEHKLAEVHERLGEWPVAQAHLESAADLLRLDGASEMRAQITADLALVLHRQGRPEAQAAAREALVLAEQSGDPAALAQTHNVLGVLAAAERARSARRTALRASAAATPPACPTWGPLLRCSTTWPASTPPRVASTTLCSRRRRRWPSGPGTGTCTGVAVLHDHVADLLHEAGREHEALEHLKSAAGAFREMDDARLRPEVWKLVTW